MRYLLRKTDSKTGSSGLPRWLLPIVLPCALWIAWSSHSGLAAGNAAPISPGAPGSRTSLQASAPKATAAGPEVKLPLDSKSVRFAVIGDSGTGEREQYDVFKRDGDLPTES